MLDTLLGLLCDLTNNLFLKYMYNTCEDATVNDHNGDPIKNDYRQRDFWDLS